MTPHHQAHPRLVVSGPAGSGKTTLVNALAARQGVPALAEHVAPLVGREHDKPAACWYALDAARLALLDSELTAALCVVGAEELMANGLPLDRVDRNHSLGNPAGAEAQAALDRALAMVAGNSEAPLRFATVGNNRP